jgi:hypothetical protein
MEGITGGLSSLLGKAKSFIQEAVQQQRDVTKAKRAQTRQERKQEQPQIKKEKVKPTDKDNFNTVIGMLNETNLRPEAKAGILGSIDVETGGTYNYTEKEDLEKTGDGLGPGYGLFMFDFMKPYYNKYLENNNLTDSPRSQIDFTLKQIYEPKTSVLGTPDAIKLKKILETGGVSEIAKSFNDIFEKGKFTDRRVSSAQKIFEKNFKVKKQMGGMVDKDPYKRQPRFI